MQSWYVLGTVLPLVNHTFDSKDTISCIFFSLKPPVPQFRFANKKHLNSHTPETPGYGEDAAGAGVAQWSYGLSKCQGEM
jgi:hypothetical protein